MEKTRHSRSLFAGVVAIGAIVVAALDGRRGVGAAAILSLAAALAGIWFIGHRFRGGSPAERAARASIPPEVVMHNMPTDGDPPQAQSSVSEVLRDLGVAAEVIHPLLTRAEEEARGFSHHYLGTEHVLLALAQGDGVPAQQIRKWGMSRAKLRDTIENMVGHGYATVTQELEVTPRVKSALTLSRKIARDTRASTIQPEHLLLALVMHRDSTAAKALERRRVDLDKAQTMMMRVILHTRAE